MHRSSVRLVALLFVVALIAAACGDSRSSDDASGSTPEDTTDDTGTDPDEGTDTTDEPDDSADVAMFGDLEWPCGPGDASGSTEQGVDDETITIGVGDDRGSTISPGLNKPQTDAVLAMVDRCNELGGINGRQIETNLHDAALFDVASAMTEACQQDFMLVGHGFAIDDQGEEIRVGCGLASVPGFTVSAVAAHGPSMFQSVPNPADQYGTAPAHQLEEILGAEAIQNGGTLFGNFAATQETEQKMVAGFEQAGWMFPQRVEYNVLGEDDWTPFALRFKQAGTAVVYYAGACGNLQLAMRAAVVNDVDAAWFSEANQYDQAQCADINTDGAMDGLYIRLSYLPIEEAAESEAVRDFIEVVEAAGASPSLLGMQGSASFLLWATAAAECGSDLTRACVLEQIAAIDEWDAGGLHAPTTPRDNDTSTCGMIVRLDGSDYTRVAPEEPGTFECDDSWAVEVDVAAVQNADLDENRVSTKFQG